MTALDRLQISVAPEIGVRLRTQARAERRSINLVVVEAILDYLATHEVTMHHGDAFPVIHGD